MNLNLSIQAIVISKQNIIFLAHPITEKGLVSEVVQATSTYEVNDALSQGRHWGDWEAVPQGRRKKNERKKEREKREKKRKKKEGNYE